MNRVRLPVVAPRSSLRSDGRRNFVHPADVHGRFATARRIGFWALIGVWLALPWLRVSGRPALFLDVEHRRFYVFGATFNAQDIWLVFFLLTGLTFGLVYLTALLGRVWCGYACPQTVFLEAIYRPIERLVEGPRETRIRRDKAPWTLENIVRKGVKHALYLAASIFVAHLFLSYFVSVPKVLEMVRRAPAEHPEAFAWALGTTVFFYGNFAWFREQLCLIVCPYGRLQSVLIDDDSIIIGYDERRGEPRGKASDPNAGDCVDCQRCVVVCPTGIDIRNGLQLDCIGCSACVDACDEVMDKLHRPRGLVRYDSQNGLQGRATRILRPRLFLLTALLCAGIFASGLAFRRHQGFEANILRLPGLPYVVERGEVRNAFEIHLVNKLPEAETFEITAEPSPGLTFVIASPTVTLASLSETRVPLFVTNDQSVTRGDFVVRLKVRRRGAPEAEPSLVTARFVGPSR
ncbi:Type cbb3 cytochrome oxidase biogenesis protein CcoG, involved in Cu oxidation [Minicystis rosea]|nr:Type cbb3 cytochrome oxidase biogenesis protein CcoG, involved in Cu oxidation [Minicystis rosea]